MAAAMKAGNQCLNQEDEFDLKEFQSMRHAEAKDYFVCLFSGAMDALTMDTIWNTMPSGLSTTMQIDWAVTTAVDYLEASVMETDSQLASKILKAEHRREAKKRQKERKKVDAEKDALGKSSIGKGLTEAQLESYCIVRDVLSGCEYCYSSEGIVNTLLKHKFDTNMAVDELLSFGEVVVVPAAPVKVTCGSATKTGASKSYKNAIANQPGSAGSQSDTSLTAQMIARNLSSSSSKSLSEADCEASSSSGSASVCLPYISPQLQQYYLMHLRTRNPGIQVIVDEGCIVYRGTQTNCCEVNEAGELAVLIDLHGQTRHPAVDILQSSLLHYHLLLASRLMDQYTAPAGVLRRISKSQKVNKAVNSKQFAVVKCVRLTYVVGQGIHSPGAVPVLRNTLMKELRSFWSAFDAVIDPENQGQIIVKVRRL